MIEHNVNRQAMIRLPLRRFGPFAGRRYSERLGRQALALFHLEYLFTLAPSAIFHSLRYGLKRRVSLA